MATSVTIQCDPDWQTWAQIHAEFVNATRDANGNITIKTKWWVRGYAYSATGKINNEQVDHYQFGNGQPDTFGNTTLKEKSFSGGSGWGAKSGSLSVYIWGQNRRNTSSDPSSGQTDSESSSIDWSIAAATFTVTFDANGASPALTTRTVTYGRTYDAGGTNPLPTRTRSGFTFLGWFTAKTGGTPINGPETVTITADQTLYAHWQANSYTVTFNANGGTTPTPSKSVTYNSTYGDLPVPTRSGYEFLGWFTDPNNGTQVTSSTTVTITDAQILYAHWKVLAILHVVQNSQKYDVTQIYYVKDTTTAPYQVIAIYYVDENGVPHQGF